MQTSSRPEAGAELVVDARCYDPVLRALEERRVLPSPLQVTSSPELDLVLVRGLDLRAYAEEVKRRLLTEVSASTGPSEPEGLDYLLYDLRQDFGERTGQVPVLGKNRDAVLGYPQHKALKFPSLPQREFALPDGGLGDGVTVGIVDTAPVRHPLLPARLVDTDAWFTPQREVSPWGGHGTFVAGLVRHEAPAARLRMRAGLSPDRGRASCWDVAQAIVSFRGTGVAVLNLSFGCVTADGAPPMLIERALSRLDEDVLVVCAAGNRGAVENPPDYLWPGAATTAVAVGAIVESQQGDHADDAFSLQRPWVDVVAAGVQVTSTFLDHVPVTLADESDPDTAPTTQVFEGYATWSGTSFAAATVTGKIAACMSQQRLSARDALERLRREPGSGVAPYAASHHHG